jgi:hypothetical protein
MQRTPWIRVSQLAGELGLSNQAVRDLIRAGKLSAAKDPEGRWLIEAESARAYVAAHAPAKNAVSDVKRIEEKLDRLVSGLSELQASSATAQQLLAATERERDAHRAEASTVREAALRLVSSAQETHTAVSGLLDVMQGQQDALIQLLAPGSPADLFTTTRND